MKRRDGMNNIRNNRDLLPLCYSVVIDGDDGDDLGRTKKRKIYAVSLLFPAACNCYMRQAASMGLDTSQWATLNTKILHILPSLLTPTFSHVVPHILQRDIGEVLLIM